MSQLAVVPYPSAFARWRSIVLLMGLAGVAHFNRVGISVAGSEVFIKRMGISETRMGWVYTAFLIVYTIGMIPGGWFTDRLGAKKTLTLLGLSMGVFVALTGMLGWAVTAPHAFWLGLLVIRGLAGACSAPLHPGAAHVVSDIMPERGRPTANGMVTAGALIGIACCYPVFGWLMDRLGWQMAFVVSGAGLVGYGLLWKAFAASPVAHAEDHPHFVAEDSRLALSIGLLRRPGLWLLTLSYAAYGYFQYLFFYWMTYYFQNVLNIPEVESRRASFYIMLAQGAGMAIGGLGTDAISHWLGATRGRRAIVMTGMGLGAVFGLIGVSMKDASSVAAALAVSMAALGMCEGVFWTTATDIGGPARGFSGAFMNAGGNVGGLISPVLTPFMAGRIGWNGAIVVACLISGFGGLIWFLIQVPSPAPVAAVSAAPAGDAG